MQQQQQQNAQQENQQQLLIQKQHNSENVQDFLAQRNKVRLPESIIQFYESYKNPNINKLKLRKVSGHRFILDERYEIYDMIGQGAYGIVVAAIDHQSEIPEQQIIAIKKIEEAFEHRIFAKRTLRELKVSRLLKHENLSYITKVLLPPSREQLDDIYVVSDLMETDLATIIKSPQPLSMDHIKFFTYQILRGLKFIHSAQILHRDIKPKNLLVNSNCDLKICDFGLARPILANLKNNVYTDYVATRWYRAPELLLQWPSYTSAVDVWSVGCILAELLRRKPFFTGNSTREQIQIIFDFVGTPNKEEIKTIPRQNLQKFVNSLPKRKPKKFEDYFTNATPQAIDLLKKMLVFDPQKRITVEEALKHPFLDQLHELSDEPIAEPVNLLDFEFENYDLTMQQIKDLIYEEILLYHYPQFLKQYDERKNNGQSLIDHILKNDNANLQDFDDSDDYDSDY